MRNHPHPAPLAEWETACPAVPARGKPTPSPSPAATRHVLDVLSPYSEENGGPLKIEHVTFVEGRGNIIVT